MLLLSAWVGPDLGPLIYTSHIARMTDACLMRSFYWSHEIFARSGLEPRSPQSLPPEYLGLQT
jgi:hypothetical protein